MVVIKPIKNNPVMVVMDKVFKNHRPFYCQKISDSFYRGSEPSLSEMKTLAQQGVKSILNLKTVSQSELQKFSEEANRNGLRYINIPLNPFRIKRSLPYIVETINSASKDNPLFIHCTYGKDRTGFVSALTNYLKQGYTMSQAIKDMNAHGFRKKFFFHMESFLKKYDEKMQKIGIRNRPMI